MSLSEPIRYINTLGAWTLYKREVWRFLKVWNQTLLSPMVSSLLFLAIFSLAMGGHTRQVEGMPFEVFVAPGLIMMQVVQNAFANASSSLILSKFQGVIVDILMPPLTPGEITFALMMGCVTRGIMVGIAVYIAIWLFVPIHITHPWAFIYFLFASSMFMGLCGVLAGLWSHSFDNLAAITNYVVTPLAFLSGTFYSVKMLPGIWYDITHMNPFFYMIDGMRYAMTGYADGSIVIGMTYLLSLNLVLWTASLWIIRSGYRLKS